MPLTCAMDVFSLGLLFHQYLDEHKKKSILDKLTAKNPGKDAAGSGDAEPKPEGVAE